MEKKIWCETRQQKVAIATGTVMFGFAACVGFLDERRDQPHAEAPMAPSTQVVLVAPGGYTSNVASVVTHSISVSGLDVTATSGGHLPDLDVHVPKGRYVRVGSAYDWLI